jgi:anti-anti-sigma regulatory factor
MSLATIESDGVLTVRLRDTLTHGTRHELFRTLQALPGPIGTIRLDARDLRDVDTAGLGMLACVVRFTRGATGHPPVLMNLSGSVHHELAAAHLLPLFDCA